MGVFFSAEVSPPPFSRGLNLERKLARVVTNLCSAMDLLCALLYAVLLSAVRALPHDGIHWTYTGRTLGLGRIYRHVGTLWASSNTKLIALS